MEETGKEILLDSLMWSGSLDWALGAVSVTPTRPPQVAGGVDTLGRWSKTSTSLRSELITALEDVVVIFSRRSFVVEVRKEASDGNETETLLYGKLVALGKL